MPVDLKEYTDVAARIALFYKGYPNGRLVTERVEIWSDVEPARVVVKALAYRSPDDPLPGTGWSWMLLPGTTNFTRGSEIENTETSAWGRAIGSLGIGIKGSIASTDEIAGHKGDSEQSDRLRDPDGGFIGTVGKGATFDTDMQIRVDPTGTEMTGFSLHQGRQRLKVVAVGPLASSLQPFLEGLEGKRVTCWGTVERVPWKKGGEDMPPYQRLQLGQIQTDDWIMPPRAEAATVPLFPDEAA